MSDFDPNNPEHAAIVIGYLRRKYDRRYTKLSERSNWETIHDEILCTLDYWIAELNGDWFEKYTPSKKQQDAAAQKLERWNNAVRRESS